MSAKERGGRPAGAAMVTPEPPVEEPLAEALAAEHAAIFGYGAVGSHLSGSAAKTAQAADTAHRARRDALVIRLSNDGGTPKPTEPFYALPFEVTDRASALRLAVEIEERTAAVWRATLAGTTDDERKLALNALVDCAIRATRWRQAAKTTPVVVPFPGRPG